MHVYVAGRAKERENKMFTILVIAVGILMMFLPYIKTVTLNDIIGGLGGLTIIIGLLVWLLAEHIDKE